MEKQQQVSQLNHASDLLELAEHVLSQAVQGKEAKVPLHGLLSAVRSSRELLQEVSDDLARSVYEHQAETGVAGNNRAGMLTSLAGRIQRLPGR